MDNNLLVRYSYNCYVDHIKNSWCILTHRVNKVDNNIIRLETEVRHIEKDVENLKK